MAPEFITPEELAEMLESYYNLYLCLHDIKAERKLTEKELEVFVRAKMLLRKANML